MGTPKQSPWDEFKGAMEDLSREYPEFKGQIEATLRVGDEAYKESVEALKAKQAREREQRKK